MRLMVIGGVKVTFDVSPFGVPSVPIVSRSVAFRGPSTILLAAYVVLVCSCGGLGFSDCHLLSPSLRRSCLTEGLACSLPTRGWHWNVSGVYSDF